MKIKKADPSKVLLCASFTLFILGISLPMFSLQKFVVIKEAFSLLQGLFDLLLQGEWFLCLVILVFSVVMPIYKFSLIWKIKTDRFEDVQCKLNNVRKLIVVGKWSMADVFLIAIMAATIKLGAIASIKVHIGLFFFALSVLTSLYLSHQIFSDYEIKPKAVQR